MDLVAQGSQLSSLGQYEALLGEGDSGQVNVHLDRPLADYELRAIEQTLLSQGVILTRPIAQDFQILTISFQKAIAPLLLIVAALSGASILGWQLFREQTANVLKYAVGIGLGLAILWLVLRG